MNWNVSVRLAVYGILRQFVRFMPRIHDFVHGFCYVLSALRNSMQQHVDSGHRRAMMDILWQGLAAYMGECIRIY